MRLILAAVFALAVIAPLSQAADAGKARAQTRAPSNKMCVATTLDNKRVGWRCLAGERCCWNAFTNQGSCVAASSGC